MIGPNIPERGLRQGDPLSSYFFILGAEALSALVRDNERRGNIHRCKVATGACKVVTGAPSISHLFFADDSFFKAVKDECEVIKQCLLTYEKASRQQINFLKSSVSFSSNTMDHVCVEVCNSLGLARTNDHGIYLELPSFVGRNKELFGFIKDWVWQRMQGWLNKFLSKAGKEILIKTVA